MKCSKCGTKIRFWQYSDKDKRDNVYCVDCSIKHDEKVEERERKKEIKKKKDEGEAYKVGFIFIGLILGIGCFYYAFLMPTGYYLVEKEDIGFLKISEINKICDKGNIEERFIKDNYEKVDACNKYSTAYPLSMAGIVIGIILFLIGVVQNLMIFNAQIKGSKGN